MPKTGARVEQGGPEARALLREGANKTPHPLVQVIFSPAYPLALHGAMCWVGVDKEQREPR